MDLHKAILVILEDRVGQDNRISRADLLGAVRGEVDILVGDREMRRAIGELRKRGHLICSNSKDGGYWMAANYDDVLSISAEYRSRALSCLTTSGKIMASGQKHFGGQLRLV